MMSLLSLVLELAAKTVADTVAAADGGDGDGAGFGCVDEQLN